MAPFRFLATMGAPCGTGLKAGVRSYPSSALSTCTQNTASVHVHTEDETGALLAGLAKSLWLGGKHLLGCCCSVRGDMA